MKKRVVAVLLSAVMGLSLLTACGSKESTGGSEVSSASSVESVEASESSSQSVEAEEDYNGKLVSEGEMALEYAEGFSIEEFKGGYRMITLKDSGAKFLTVPEDMKVPEELDADVTVLQLPLNNVYIASTGIVSLVDAIGALDHVKLVATDVDSWYLDDVVAAMNNGEIAFSGNYKEPDYEMMAANDIQLHIDTTMIDNCPEVLEKFDELGIPNLIEGSSKEGHPLARVEWVKVLGVLFDKEAEADSYFAGEKELLEQSTATEDHRNHCSYGVYYFQRKVLCEKRRGLSGTDDSDGRWRLYLCRYGA